MESPIDDLDSTMPQTLFIEDAMRLAADLHLAGQHEDAFTIYTRVLEAAPNHPDALDFLGILAHNRGCEEDAIRLMSHSVALVPDHAGFRNNFGNLLLDSERFEEAEREYRQALVLDPDRPDALNNYAVLCKGLGRYEEAERSLLHALELAPDFTDARNNLAGLYFQLRRFDESLEQAREAFERAPRDTRTREIRGSIYCKLGRFDDAAKIYREWLEEEPGNPKAAHHLAACTGEGVPARASDAYVQCLFDRFANSFDSRLATLGYQAPALVARAVSDCVGWEAASLDVLDAGCGTGLCGPLLKPFASRLTGVDLSGGMLEKAQGRDLYHALHQQELTAFMAERPDDFDVVVSADTLVYFGELGAAMRAAARTLRSGGWLCFTVEALEEGVDGYRLQHHGRYAHSRAYLETALEQAGLRVVEIQGVVPRYEGGVPVEGWLAIAQRPAGAGVETEAAARSGRPVHG